MLSLKHYNSGYLACEVAAAIQNKRLYMILLKYANEYARILSYNI